MTPIDIQLEHTAHRLNHLAEAVLEESTPPEELHSMAEAAQHFLNDGRTLVRGLTVCDMPGSDRSDRQLAHSMLRHGVHPRQSQLGNLTGAALRAKLNTMAQRSRANGAKNKSPKRDTGDKP